MVLERWLFRRDRDSQHKAVEVDTARAVDHQRTERFGEFPLERVVYRLGVGFAADEQQRRRHTLDVDLSAIEHVELKAVARLVWIETFCKQILLRRRH